MPAQSKSEDNWSDLLKRFYTDITKINSRGDAREESYYSIIEKLLNEYAISTGRKSVEVRTNPRKTVGGNPDFRVWHGTGEITGYIEAKAPSTTDLDAIASSEQLMRYRNTFPNLILTNFFEFRLYRDGTLVDKVLAARPVIALTVKSVPPLEDEQGLLDLFEKFYSFSLPERFSANTLAVELAKRTRFLREVILEQLEEEKVAGTSELTGFYHAFKDYLIAHLTEDDFADLYAQTVTYGLFAARTRANSGFTRKSAYELIPNTIGILRDVFRFVSLGTLPEQMVWIIDDITHVLAAANPRAILDRFFHEGRGKDPIVHFYETFLAKYDPDEREKRGVYYTPEPVVAYIVRSLNELLKSRFDKANGFASPGVTLLDPAAGTMTFVARAIVEAMAEQEAAFGSGSNDEFIRNHILKNFYAFELMMAPYAIGHLKMSFILQELGFDIGDNDRFKFYLTNTLERDELGQTDLPIVKSLAEESHLAGQVKQNQPILAILGNPPYSGHSANASKKEVLIEKGNKYTKLVNNEWKGVKAVKTGMKTVPTFIGEILHDYFQVDGEPLGEKNPKWLHDDYVKFIRFTQWKIDQAGNGVVGVITNHSYLDNPTFRGMRQSLLKTYDEIYILDLHGNTLKMEKAPDGSVDKNVFDIRQGVAIAFFIKKDGANQNARVYHANLWGTRQGKYDWLDDHELINTDWQEIAPQSPFYFFVPRDEKTLARYQKYPSVTRLFPVNSVGIVTARDRLTIHLTSDEAWNTVRTFASLDPELAREAYKLGKDVRDWRVEWAQKDLNSSGPKRAKITPIHYRPFDTRYTYFTGKSRGFLCYPRADVMRHMLAGDNLALITPRQHKSKFGVLISEHIGTHKTVEAYDINYYFPLYLHPDVTKSDLFHNPDTAKIEPNLAPELVTSLTDVYGKSPSPEEVFYYIYAVLYAPTYREQYAEFLKTDFPRVPFTAEASLFRQMAELGECLVSLHLLKDKQLDKPGIHFDGKGGNLVGTTKAVGLRYDAETERVYINSGQFFHSIPKELWEYQVGGYQVLEKWLKDRKGRKLVLEDIRHYCKVARSLQLTMEIQEQIDDLFDQIEADTIEFPDLLK